MKTISPASSLPNVPAGLLLDGTTQPGYAGMPLIEIDGGNAGAANGLVITGPGVIVRGLMISGFAGGAGILITGPSASGNVIQADVIGTHATGLQARPNNVGISIIGGAHDNTIGGTTTSAGNVIEGNVTGVLAGDAGSVRNSILGNRIFGDGHQNHTSAGNLQFDGSNYVSLPSDLIQTFEQTETIEAWFQTASGGVILGYQYQGYDPSTNPWGNCCWAPTLYVGNDGKLYGEVWNGGANPIISAGTVADGQWHHVALVVNGQAQTQSLYLDGQLQGTLAGSIQYQEASLDQIGTGFTNQEIGVASNWPATPGGWYGFQGQIDNVQIWSAARSPDQIQRDMTAAPTGTEPGLEVYYGFDERQGTTAHDSTAHHRDAALAATGSMLPEWVSEPGQAIDLGGDGITYNLLSRRQGPNNLQNYPIVVTSVDGRERGWLGGSLPSTPYHIEVFASSGYAPDGSGEAEVYLGSIDVTTDASGQALFDLPYTAPAGRPIVTATATDPAGNTSEVSLIRRSSLQVPGSYVRFTAGASTTFAAASGDALVLNDPDTGPLYPGWNLSLSVPAGTLTLSTTAGLAGAGNGTGSLQYHGGLLELNAALEGLRFTAPAGRAARS